MKSIIAIIVFFTLASSAQAASYKCLQESGKYLYSDKPCMVSKLPKDTIMTTATGKVAKLSTTKNPIPIPSEIVDGLFDRIKDACQTKNGDMLLAQFSTEVQKTYLANKPKKQAIFDTIASSCNVFKSIRNEIKKSSEPVLYATKMPSKEILLCFYTARKGLEDCKGDIKVTIEDNQFKLNARY